MYHTPCTQKGCDGYLVVYTTRVQSDSRLRYFHCSKCGHKPENNIQVLPLTHAPRRERPKRQRPVRREPAH